MLYIQMYLCVIEWFRTWFHPRKSSNRFRQFVGFFPKDFIYKCTRSHSTGVTKAVVCVILSGMVHIKEPLAANLKE